MAPLGYRGNSKWRDMSEYAVHFTKGSDRATAYEVVTKILGEGRIEPSRPLGAARYLLGLGDSQKPACFSEIPLDLLDRLIRRRSPYGIGFRHDLLVAQGGARVWYLDKDGPASAAFEEVIRARMVGGGIDPEDPLWRLTPFIDYPGEYGWTQYRFEWEREWRVPGGLDFGPDEVAFLFLPEEEHPNARSFLREVLEDNGRPAYVVPCIDPRWDLDTIQESLGHLNRSSPLAGDLSGGDGAVTSVD
jgi:hypothetical protein